MVSMRAGIDRSTSSNDTSRTGTYQCQKIIISDQPERVAGSFAKRRLDRNTAGHSGRRGRPSKGETSRRTDGAIRQLHRSISLRERER